ncbi:MULTISPECIES: hypothetical protein [unclassified Clostridium]|uniref:hypothetical protein n=1 Tax=unclassified Clostridium TaxID=2614128 RepID=UPI0032180174
MSLIPELIIKAYIPLNDIKKLSERALRRNKQSMGQNYTLKCSKCDYEKTFNTGIGFLFMEIKEQVAKYIVDGKYGKEMRSFIDEYTTAESYVRREIYHCKNCNNLSEELQIKAYTKANFYGKTYRCSMCKKDIMKVIDDDKVHMLNCPKCHEILEIAEVMMWD